MPHRNTAAPDALAATRPWQLAIVACWLASTALAFWWYGLRDRGTPAASARVAAFDPVQGHDAPQWLAARLTGAAPGPQPLTLVHLRDPDCGCNQAADTQVEDLRRQYAARGLRVATVAVHAGGPQAPRWLSATPAAALLDADGALLYLGPVADAGFCSRRATPVSRALDSAIAGVRAPARPTLATGCFCT